MTVSHFLYSINTQVSLLKSLSYILDVEMRAAISVAIFPVLSNIKLSVRLQHVENIREKVYDFLEDSRVLVRREELNESYFVATAPKRTKATFTVFYCGHINVVGVKTLEAVYDLFPLLGSLLNYEREDDLLDIELSTAIDNMTATGRLALENEQYVNLTRLCEEAEEWDVTLETRYNVECFPGCTIKTRNHGSLLVFSNGKFVCVGIRSELDTIPLTDFLLELLHSDSTIVSSS